MTRIQSTATVGSRSGDPGHAVAVGPAAQVPAPPSVGVTATPAISHFCGAPPDAWLTPEGWLVIDDEAWTLDEWLGGQGETWRAEHRHLNRARGPRQYASDQERLSAINASKTRYRARKRSERLAARGAA